MGRAMVTPISSFTPSPLQARGGMVGMMALPTSSSPILSCFLSWYRGGNDKPTFPRRGGVESGQTQNVAYALLPCFPSKNLGIAIPTILSP